MLLLPIWEVMGLSCDYYNPFAEDLSVTSGDVNRAIEDYLCAEGFPKFPMINYDGEPLRDLAKAAGQLTQKEMATALNMSEPTISRRLDDPEKITMDEFRVLQCCSYQARGTIQLGIGFAGAYLPLAVELLAISFTIPRWRCGRRLLRWRLSCRERICL